MVGRPNIAQKITINHNEHYKLKFGDACAQDQVKPAYNFGSNCGSGDSFSVSNLSDLARPSSHSVLRIPQVVVREDRSASTGADPVAIQGSAGNLFVGSSVVRTPTKINFTEMNLISAKF